MQPLAGASAAGKWAGRRRVCANWGCVAEAATSNKQVRPHPAASHPRRWNALTLRVGGRSLCPAWPCKVGG